ncbi:MAG TPA: DUF2378 family protein [Polyangiaceae bacterium]|nr:DUF2378 family protein [Polyangiaceae bacterium]
MLRDGESRSVGRSASGPAFATEKAELEAWIDETPPSAAVKGMYVESLFSMLAQRGAARPTDKRYLSFKDYPLRELMRLMVDAVGVLYPETSPREGMIALGRLAFPTLVSTTVGKVIFSIAGSSWVRALNLVTKAYEISLKPGTATVEALTDTSARVELREIWNFGSSYQVGVFEGAMEHFGVHGSVQAVTVGRRCDVDLKMHWRL